MRHVETRLIRIEDAKIFEISLDDHPIKVYIAPENFRLDINGVFTTNRSEGKFGAVVDFGTLLSDREMSGSTIPEVTRWNSQNLPEGVTVREFNPEINDVVSYAADVIEQLANNAPHPYFYLKLAKAYQEADGLIAQYQIPQDHKNWQPVAIVRGGVLPLVAAGFPIEQQILINAKRLNRLDNPNLLAVGFNFDIDDLGKISGNDIYIRERAQASMSTLIALDLVLAAHNCIPKNSIWAGTAATQQGYELALVHSELMEEMYGKKTELDAGRLCFEMTGPPHPYYIIGKNGGYAVGDGGDWSELLLPPNLRSVIPRLLNTQHMQNLENIDHKIAAKFSPNQVIDSVFLESITALCIKFGYDSAETIGKVFLE